MINKFGKSSLSLLNHKASFFDDNEKLLNECKRYASIYVEQPVRKKCKNCNNDLGKAYFYKFDVPYTICKVCTHLNGMHEDTNSFCDKIYVTEDDYADNYKSSDIEKYKLRTKEIYVPKVEFLIEVLKKQDCNVNDFQYLDVGAGSGYMISAMLEKGIKSIRGVEVSETQVRYGNKILGKELLECHSLDKTTELIKTTDANIISMIGVLEHLCEPREVLSSIRDNKNIKYLMLSLPLFSPCVFFEMVNENVMHRQLTGGHTHLYTNESIQYFCDEYGFKRIGEWWFGTDMFDLYRHINVQLENINVEEKVSDLWRDMFMEVIDDMQLKIDEKKMSSEIHVVLDVSK